MARSADADPDAVKTACIAIVAAALAAGCTSQTARAQALLHSDRAEAAPPAPGPDVDRQASNDAFDRLRATRDAAADPAEACDAARAVTSQASNAVRRAMWRLCEEARIAPIVHRAIEDARDRTWANVAPDRRACDGALDALRPFESEWAVERRRALSAACDPGAATPPEAHRLIRTPGSIK